MEFNVREFAWNDGKATSLRSFAVNVVGQNSNHLDSDPADFSSIRSKTQQATIDGVRGTLVPVTGFVSGVTKKCSARYCILLMS